jgi:hypothetical protein
MNNLYYRLSICNAHFSQANTKSAPAGIYQFIIHFLVGQKRIIIGIIQIENTIYGKNAH